MRHCDRIAHKGGQHAGSKQELLMPDDSAASLSAGLNQAISDIHDAMQASSSVAAQPEASQADAIFHPEAEQIAEVKVVEVKEPPSGERVEVQLEPDEQLKLDFDIDKSQI